MFLTEITEAQRMEWAQQLARAAACLDWLSSEVAIISPEERLEGKAFVETMHTIAMTLCGPRVLEIYGPDEVQSEAVADIVQRIEECRT